MTSICMHMNTNARITRAYILMHIQTEILHTSINATYHTLVTGTCSLHAAQDLTGTERELARLREENDKKDVALKEAREYAAQLERERAAERDVNALLADTPVPDPEVRPLCLTRSLYLIGLL